MKTAVLLARLANNHALPDGNKRTVLATTIAFCNVNGYVWVPPAGDEPDGQETFQHMLAIGAAPLTALVSIEDNGVARSLILLATWLAVVSGGALDVFLARPIANLGSLVEELAMQPARRAAS